MYEYNAKMIYVVDGDTFDFEVDLGFKIKHTIRVRLFGVDTPEIYHPRNKAELDHGRRAKQFVEEHFLDKVGTLNTVKGTKGKDSKGKYGRYLANFTVKAFMSDRYTELSASLVNAGLSKKESYDE